MKTLANDQDIVIKPADKGGTIVIIDIKDYEKACSDHLSDPNFYEELPDDPTATYKQHVLLAVDVLQNEGLLIEFEQAMLVTEERTPNFYGLPNIHK